MIEVKNLTKYYGSQMAIEDVNFQGGEGGDKVSGSNYHL